MAFACEACIKKQPKILQGIVHGGGPDNSFDYLIVSTAIAIVVFTLLFSIKWLIRPGENEGSHIKRFILNSSAT